jgi:hypothetical protein
MMIASIFGPKHIALYVVILLVIVLGIAAYARMAARQ